MACCFTFHDYTEIPVPEAQRSLRDKAKGILGPTEQLELAFKCRNHKLYFTRQRIVIKSSSILALHAHNYTTIPYDSIACFAVKPTAPNLSRT
jgi:hypothetical protein